VKNYDWEGKIESRVLGKKCNEERKVLVALVSEWEIKL